MALGVCAKRVFTLAQLIFGAGLKTHARVHTGNFWKCDCLRHTEGYQKKSRQRVGILPAVIPETEDAVVPTPPPL